MKDYIMVIDEGTTGTRTIIYDRSFTQIANVYQALNVFTPDKNKVEQDFDEIFEKSLENCKKALSQAGLTASDIASIGIACQRNTSACWNKKTGKLYGRGIVWQDTRTAKALEEKNKHGHSEMVMKINGFQVTTVVGYLFLEWMIQNNEKLKKELYMGEVCFGTIDTWLIWKLTEGRSYKIASSNASALGMFDPRKNAWSKEIVTDIGVDPSVLPEVVDDNAYFGDTYLLGEKIPITGAVADQQASLFGQNCRSAGTAKCTNGTGSFLDINIGEEFAYPCDGMGTMVAWTLNGKRTYMQEGFMSVTGSAIQWLRDGLGIIKSSEETYELAMSVPDTNSVYFAINLSGANTPYFDPFARGALIGISRGTTKAHIVRATLEGIAFGIADIMENIESKSNIHMKNIKIDGGASKNDFLAQAMSDVIGCEIYRPEITDGTALGAALISALGAGMFTEDELPDPMKYDHIFSPQIGKEEREEKMYFYKKAVSRSFGWLKTN